MPVNTDLYMAFNHHFSFVTGALSQDFFLYSFDWDRPEDQ